MAKLILYLLMTSLLISIGCSSAEKIDVATAEGAYKLAQKYEKDERFEEALSYYQEVKNKHPYSRYATESELRVAEIHFDREAFAEAESAYRFFKEFHPKHEKIDYVTFRLGLSFYKQLPSSIDRDLSLAHKSILYFDEVLHSFPKSTWVPKSKEFKKKSLKMLADKEYYIANFYFIREKYDSALGRFEDLLEKFPNIGLDAKALYGAALSSHKLKKEKKMNAYLQQLKTRFPKSDEYKRANGEVGHGS